MQTPAVITPIIHLNGDRREALMAQLEHAYHAVSAAMDALRQCAPNGRNYYPEVGRFDKAETQYEGRMAHLRAVRDSLQAEVIKIQQEARSGGPHETNRSAP